MDGETILTVADLRRELADYPGDTPVRLQSRSFWGQEPDLIQLDWFERDGEVIFY